MDIIEVAKKISAALENDTELDKFGMHLLDTKDKQDLISIHQREKLISLEEKCKNLLELWSKRTAVPKWEQVIETLQKVNLNQLAAQLETALRPQDSRVGERHASQQDSEQSK